MCSLHNVAEGLECPVAPVGFAANDIFHTRNQSWWMNVKDVSLYKDSDGDTRRLMLTVSYIFNPKKSKYKGEGAANDEMKRL